MKKAVIALIAATAFTGSAFAADMAVKAPRPLPPPPPVTYWTGCWVGGGVGYGLFDQESTAFDTFNNFVAPGAQLTSTDSDGGRGWLGRVGGGCDYQFQQFVIGAFADYDWTDLHGQFNDRWNTGVGPEKMNNQWAVGGRIGWVAMPNFMTFVSAGYTQAHFNAIAMVGNDFPNIGVPTGLGLDAATYHGWFVGGGGEYAFNWLPGLFWKTEYRFSEFNTQSVIVRDLTDGDLVNTYAVKKWVQTITTSLVWRFNFGGAPLVAKY
jgi:outer membrane immunogenic protein